MTILFEREGDTTFAIAKNEVFKGRVHDELMYAEIVKTENVFTLFWEDDYKKKYQFSTEELAKAFILREYDRHFPHPNGSSYDIDDND